MPPQLPDLDYEQIKIGDEVSFSVRITEESVNQFADLSGDHNPLHMDEGYAKTTQFGRRVVHGMLLASYVSQLVGMRLPGKNALFMSQETKFLNPCFIGDTITVKGRVSGKSDVSRTIALDIAITRDPGSTLLQGRATVMVIEPKKKSKKSIQNLNMDLSSKNILITGGSGEIGGAIARLLAAHNAKLAITYHGNQAAAEELKEGIATQGKSISIHKLDLTAMDGIDNLIKEIRSNYGGIDTLIHCATNKFEVKEFQNCRWSDFQKDIDIVVKGFFTCVQRLLPEMIERKRGNIISILTTDILGAPQANHSGYVTAKYGLMGLSKALAKEYGIHGIRVNMISPGLTDTKLVSFLPQRYKDVVAHQTPLKRIATPEDIANIALFLVSDLSEYLSGVNIPVCGGHDMI